MFYAFFLFRLDFFVYVKILVCIGIFNTLYEFQALSGAVCVKYTDGTPGQSVLLGITSLVMPWSCAS